jgi:Flp pilus assembly protein TadD
VSQHFDLGVHYFLRRDYANALRSFREAIREMPTDPQAWSYYGVCLAHLGQATEAEAALSHAVGLAPQDPETWFHLGVARSLRDEWSEAANAYRRAVALSPGDLVAWHRLGVALAESGEGPAAEAAFERALVLSRDLDSETVPDAPPMRDDHLAERGEREGAREAKSWLELALSLLSLGEEEEALAAYERAYTLDPERAQHSLFRPMLRLLTAVQGGPVAPEEAPDLAPPRPAVPRPGSDRRPDVG